MGNRDDAENQPSVVPKRYECAAEVMCADAGLHADETRRQVGLVE
jgi:hypothetical protein